ncbi:MAG TPA: hypothetical protein VL460_01460 [Caulobacteraceae bacterium]|jgi:hypothetical protein|nr:hypothetical protein [Caulobacteraceae bacterium]
MPHRTPRAPNAATGRQTPNDQARGQQRTVRPEPRSYAAPDVADSTLAGPAAGEVGDYADEGAPSGGMQQGGDRTRIPEKNAARPQGRKTREANLERFNRISAEWSKP